MGYPGLEKGFLDPRTKLAVLAVLPVLTVCVSGFWSMVLTAAVGLTPMILLSFVRRCATAGILSVLCYAGILICCQYVLNGDGGGLQLLRLILSMFGTVLFPCVTAAVYLKRSTSDSAFICALYKLHFPGFLIIPLAVIFRYFPVLAGEYRRISLALRQRGIKKITQRFVPLIVNAVQLSSEIAAAALLRGIDSPARTQVDENRMCLQDWLVLLLCAAALCAVLTEKLM